MHQKLPKVLGLPVFASDVMSSIAYATEEIMLALVLAGSVALRYVPPITIAIVALLVIVATSYRQTIFAYPSGGGAYIVAHENLGKTPGLVAGAALLVDYVLTVAVSIAAGIAAIASAVQPLAPYRVELCVVFIGFIAIANLRGLRESGLLFAGPAYAFIASFVVLIATGLIKWATGILHPVPSQVIEPAGPLTLFLILRAFSGGCVALTGTEAIANGVPAFRPPESRNAAATLTIMTIVMGVFFLGISALAHALGITPNPHETVVSQITEAVFGRDWFYYVIQSITMLILVLAAQTSFAGFPRLTSIMAGDRFLPRQFANLGDRLAFSNGIIGLWMMSTFLVVVFRGDVHRLIPLYAVGVFISFTLSQYGMVVHTKRHKERGWRRTMIVSAIGGTTTGTVAIVVAAAKFQQGAFVVVFLIPLLVAIFMKIHQHYMRLAAQLRLPAEQTGELPEMRNTVLVLVPGIHKGVLLALQYAKSLSGDCRALFIETEPETTALIEERWEKWGQGIPLVVLESPYRSLVDPLLQYLDEVKEERARHMVTVVIPEFVPAKWWHKVLHNQSGILLKFVLLSKPDIVVANIRYHLEE